MFWVQVIETETEKVEREIGPYTTERMAERAEDGVNRNLNHDRFHTDIREEK